MAAPLRLGEPADVLDQLAKLRLHERRSERLQLQTDVGGRSRVRLLALVDDGAYRYTVPLALALTPAGWTVTAVAE